MLLFAESFLHHFDPIAVHFSPDNGVRWYGLAYAVGFLLAWALVRWLVKTGRAALTLRDVGDMMFAVILGVLVGGRLGYAILYEQHLFTDFSSTFPWWSLLAINKGGMASHGGMAGVILALTIFGRRRGISVLHMLDLGALASTIGLFLGRIANFINAELWGKPIPAWMQSPYADPPWWSIKYPMQITERWLAVVQRSPLMNDKEYADLLGAAAADFNIHAPMAERAAAVAAEAQHRLDVVREQLAPVIGLEGRFWGRVVGLASDSSATLHQQVVQTIKPLLTAYYPSQIIQAITDGPILALILVLLWLKPRKPGVIGSWFLVTYAFLRIVTEVFRQPDAGVSLTLGLSRGQLLSVIMLLTGCVCVVIACRRSVPPMGGLLKPMYATAAQSGATA